MSVILSIWMYFLYKGWDKKQEGASSVLAICIGGFPYNTRGITGLNFLCKEG